MATKTPIVDDDVQYTLTEDFGKWKRGETVSAKDLGSQVEAAIEKGVLAPVGAATPPAAVSAPDAPTQQTTDVHPTTGTITVTVG